MAKKRSSSASGNSGNPATSFKDEVILWAVLALSIILFISNFGIAGAVGNLISSIFFGLFGLAAYLFPVLLFAGTAFIMANKDNTVAMVKAAAAFGLFIFACMFLELVSGSSLAKSPLDSYLWAAQNKLGGGLFGGALAWAVRSTLGTVSAFVIDIIMMVICIVLVTQRSLWKPIQSGGKKMYASAKKETMRQRQQYNERRQRRIDNKVTGVSTDTSLKNASSPEASDKVNEIRPDPAFVQDFPIYMMNQPKPRQRAEAKSRQNLPEQQEQEEPQIQQALDAVGMGYADIMPLHESVNAAHAKKAEAYDKIIPIANRKVALQPNAANEALSGGTSLPDAQEDFFAKSSALFSGLLPGADRSEPMEVVGTADANPAAFDALQAETVDASLQDTADSVEAMHFDSDGGSLWDIEEGLADGTDGDAPADMDASIIMEDTFMDTAINQNQDQNQDQDHSMDALGAAWGFSSGTDRSGEPFDVASVSAGTGGASDGLPVSAGTTGPFGPPSISAKAAGTFGASPVTAVTEPFGASPATAGATGAFGASPATAGATGAFGASPATAGAAGAFGASPATAGATEAFGTSSVTAGFDRLFDAEPASDGPDALSGIAPVSAQELMEQQLQAAAPAPKRAQATSAEPSAETRRISPTPVAAMHRQPKQSAAEAASNVADVQIQLQQAPPKIKREYILPPVELLDVGNPSQTGDSREHLQETALKLQQTLKNFGVNVTILNVSCGPSVTRYEIQPEMGVKVSKIVNLADDIKLNLAAADIRIEAPIPGKAAIGIEVPNKETVPVIFRDLIESEEFRRQKSPCTFAAGKDISGQTVVTDICKMPHLLIAGATGSGKSVCINTIIMSIIYKANPDDVKLIMIDPKVVELSVYNGIPHLLLPVVTDPKKAAGALHWAVSEMMDRYQKFADYGVRDMKGYNAKVQKIADIPDESKPQKMPYIVIIVDELADLMMAAPGDVEDAICRLAQLARAAGIHLIIATQRPSVNVITGLIKANMPSRIAFSVTSGIDSRTILDMNGAEKLLGKGDMLFYPQGLQKPIRVQGAFVSDSEVSKVVEFLTERNGTSEYDSEIAQQVANAASGSGGASADASTGDDRDVYFADAARLLIEKDKASVSMLQRYFKIGFNRAARIMDQLEEAGVVGPEEGTKPRKIMMGPEEFAQYEEEVL